jgi:hypothetical protein
MMIINKNDYKNIEIYLFLLNLDNLINKYLLK